jgi:AraC family transcriptional regulator, regulatory protein of adaptative response / methylated-DNA-[protein]-cysteine methyltransferase
VPLSVVLDQELSGEEYAPDDYEKVKAIIVFISERWREQPSLEIIAEHVGLTTLQLHHMFRRWSGLTPKTFLQAVTFDHAKRLVRQTSNILDASLELGLSGPGRLHDLFVTHEALSPGEYKKGGAGLLFTYGFHPSPFGEALIVTTQRGLAGLGFVDAGDRHAALEDMQNRWPDALWQQDQNITFPYITRIFSRETWKPDTPLRVIMIGSDFEIRIWQALLTIPFGQTSTYSDIARRIGNPKAARAVGTGIGRNPISFVVPCHRVLGKGGSLTGYHWGLTRKQVMLGWES